MIRMIFFDIDNTLINHREAERRAIEAVQLRFFPGTKLQDFVMTWKEASKKNWLLFEAGKLTFEEQRVQRIVDVSRKYNYTINSTKARQIFSEYLDHYESSWMPFPYTQWFLQLLKKQGRILGIISNGNLEQQQKKLEKADIRKFFSPRHIFVSGDVGWAKPQRELFAHAQMKSGFDGGDICVMGDDIELDLKPAASLGWHTILVDHFQVKRQAKTNDATLRSFLGGIKKIRQEDVRSSQHE